MSDVLRVGMVGYAFMGAAHAQAWRNAPRFFDLPLTPELTAVAGRNPEAVSAAAERLGFASIETDWRRLVERDDIDLIDICTPGDSHAEIAIAALQAGKHVLCEKPLANTVEEAEQMAAAARVSRRAGGVRHVRIHLPADAGPRLARRLIDAGRIGDVRQVRAQYLQDWLHDADAPMTWRLDKAKSGSGALGDIGAHLVDTTQWLTGQSITGVSAIMETFVTSRPLAGERSGLGGHGDVGAERSAGRRHRRRRRAVHRAVRRRRDRDVRGHPVRPRPQERVADRDQRHRRLARIRLRGKQRAAVLRRHATGRGAGLPANPGHRARAPLRERMVAAGARPRLRARLHPPGR